MLLRSVRSSNRLQGMRCSHYRRNTQIIYKRVDARNDESGGLKPEQSLKDAKDKIAEFVENIMPREWVDASQRIAAVGHAHSRRCGIATYATDKRKDVMTIELNHTVVPARDKLVSARFFAKILGLDFDEDTVNYFAPVKVNGALTLDFVDNASWASDFASGDRLPIQHYAFKVDEAEFDAIFERIKAEGMPYGSEPNALGNMDINHRGGGRGVYFRDLDGHVLELLTTQC